MRTLMIAIVTVSCFAATVSAQQRVEIAGSQVQKIQSSIVGQEYALQIMLPPGYEKSTKNYPVVYLMDSQWDFPLVTAIYGEQYYDGFIPEMIIVGVTWGGTNPNPDSLRARDYTPTQEARLPQSGGAPKFLSALRQEIIPYVEANYRADKNDRTLMGCSLGGLFTLYSLFTSDGLFNRYVATTPAYAWDKEVLYKYAQAYNEKPSKPARLFITMGEMERGLPGFKKFVKFLQSRNYKSLQIKSRILENTGHSGNKAEGYARGLQYVFERPSLKLGSEALTKYTGTYKTAKGNTVKIEKENARLVASLDNANKDTLYAASDTDFYAKSELLNINFKTDNGKVTGFELKRYGGVEIVNKVQ
jgi:predicted alpha/beta superfamily hydrolase